VDLRWSAATDNVAVKGYRIYRNSVRIANLSASSLSFTDTPLADGIPDTYFAMAYDQAGNVSPTSNEISVTPTAPAPGDSTPPTAPGNLSASAGDGAVTLSWSAATDDVGVASYRVFRNGAQVASTTSSTTTFSDTGLTNGTTYSYVITAVDAAGNSSSQSNTASATPQAPAPPSSGVDPSGESLPVGDIPGWHQIFADDFAQSVPLGSFPSQVNGKWGAYPYPWTGTPSWATYYPAKTTSVHDGQLDMWLHYDSTLGKYLITAPYPKIGTADNNQLYGRYVMRFKTDQFRQYHASWLLWPKSEQWPRDGEIDFPEGDFNSTISAFMHRQNGTSGGDQDAYSTSVPMYGAWHTAVIEWLPTRCTFILDGKVIGQSTSRIPNTPMHFVIQNGGSFGVSTPDPSVQGHVYLDWVAVYSPA
jgi:chitodextrinase